MNEHQSIQGKPYYISCDAELFDFERVHHWLSTDAYWCIGIPRGTVELAFRNSVAFGLFHEKEGQVGIARMITDKATFAYLADVYIAREHREKGLGKDLMIAVDQHQDLQGLRRIMLTTSDMHPLYRQFGFDTPAKPEIMMEKLNQDIYKTA